MEKLCSTVKKNEFLNSLNRGTSLIKMRDWIKNQKNKKTTKIGNKTVLNFLDLLETVIHHDTIDQVSHLMSHR